MTLYNGEHFFNPNPLQRYSLGTKNKNLKINADGSLTLYAGAGRPVLALHPCLLARQSDRRRLLAATAGRANG
jgi:Protein of unknown function (DUF1214)